MLLQGEVLNPSPFIVMVVRLVPWLGVISVTFTGTSIQEPILSPDRLRVVSQADNSGTQAEPVIKTVKYSRIF